jgi:hypothetical protein
VKLKAPEPDRGVSLFFVDEHGSPHRRDPRQPAIPGMDPAPAQRAEVAEDGTVDTPGDQGARVTQLRTTTPTGTDG